ncbi:hypothetical protein C8R47DRAFT_1228669 [Mycena vitilis]|nr:hypothetical protein C8R47DRAFT_1228669 [Mycena vitilis]
MRVLGVGARRVSAERRLSSTRRSAGRPRSPPVGDCPQYDAPRLTLGVLFNDFDALFRPLLRVVEPMTRLSVQELLNPVPPSSTHRLVPPPPRFNTSRDLRADLGPVSQTPHASFAPAAALPPPRIPPPPPPAPPLLPPSQRTPRRLQPKSGRTVEYGTNISHRSGLSALYRYAADLDLAYPVS